MVSVQRFVISARVIGSVVRDAPKLKVFMISVLWSDEAEVIIYRSFQDFKKFHRQLKKRFPHMNPFRKNRVLPKFNGKARRRSLQQNGSKRSMQRMKFLESYCIELLKCDQIVTQSSQLTQFFLPQDRDLQTDYTKNSIMILLSDGSDGGGGNLQPTGSITHPLVTQTYRCVAAYDTKDAKNRPFRVAVNEKLDVLIKDPAGWWLVENEEKRLAWFPAPYLELWEGEDEGDDAGLQLGGSLYCAVRSYTAKKDDEVSVAIGSVVEVLRKSDDGWWLIRFNGKGGYIPSMYLQPYNNPRAGLFSMQRRLHSSTLNLSATSSEPRSSPQPSLNEANEFDSAGPSTGGPSVPGRLHKARSLDVLTETWTQAQQTTERDASTRVRRTSNTSTELSFSSLSSDSESSSSVSEGAQQRDAKESEHSSPSIIPSEHRNSSKSTSSSRSASSSEVSSNTPKVPPRPKTEEILTRCTTMTRKAALATKTQLQIRPEIHSR